MLEIHVVFENVQQKHLNIDQQIVNFVQKTSTVPHLWPMKYRSNPHIYVYIYLSNNAYQTDNSPHIFIDGVHWTRFWWYTPTNGWPARVTDVLGGLFTLLQPLALIIPFIMLLINSALWCLHTKRFLLL